MCILSGWWRASHNPGPSVSITTTISAGSHFVTNLTAKQLFKDNSVSTRIFYPPMPGHESSLRWGGKKFEELPIVHIKATYNNTHIQVTDNTGKSMIRTSCGAEGFKNVKKSTPIAAQTAGISAAAKAQGKGVSYVRVVVKGLGQGRVVSNRRTSPAHTTPTIRAPLHLRRSRHQPLLLPPAELDAHVRPIMSL
uniref:Ribosomal protein S11 n=1 Tax=Paramormyrops kingsleyae TaxID=1676925 RepID=A0A3B3SZI9_9TELE